MNRGIEGGDIFGDRLTTAEIERMRIVLAELKQVLWSKPLLNTVEKRGGITLENQAHLLEARIAHELHRHGVVPDIEYKAGAGESRVDFRIPGAPQFLVEVVSIRASEGVRAATRKRGAFIEFDLSTRNLVIPGRERESEESEAVVVQQKLVEKVYADEKVTKFPPRQKGVYHGIVADLRGYLGGWNRMEDLKGDAIEFLYGMTPKHLDLVRSRAVVPGKYIPQPDGGSKPLAGLLHSENPTTGASYFRERIHFVHFVCESTYGEGDMRGPSESFVIPNLLLWPEEEFNAAMSVYPLVELPKAQQ